MTNRPYKAKHNWIFPGVLILLVLVLLCNAPFFRLCLAFLRAFIGLGRDYYIRLAPVDSGIHSVAAEETNRLLLRASVYNGDGRPVSGFPLKFAVEKGPGRVSDTLAVTNAFGECLIEYIPPEPVSTDLIDSSPNVTISARTLNNRHKSAYDIGLVTVPVVLIHGYQANGDVFGNMKAYLEEKGYRTCVFNYASEEGVLAAAEKLHAFLDEQIAQFRLEGIGISKMDVIAHSMGGLVVRTYTTSSIYPTLNNIHKIILISVPNHGTPWAATGLAYFHDQGIMDMVPDGELFTRIFPGQINRGLNPSIQTANLLGQYDEVVSRESASLDEWNIQTDIFSIGENNLSMSNLFKGTVFNSPNHMVILNNRKVFEKVELLLSSRLSTPRVK